MNGPIVVVYNLVENDKEDYYEDVKNVEEALVELGYDVTKLWVGDDIEDFIFRIKKASPKCIFNLCEEVWGNSWGEVYIAGLLELLGLPYTGSGPFALGLSLDKAKTKDVLKANNIKVPLYKVFKEGEAIPSVGLEFPLIVKPLHEDGSFGIDCGSVVYDEEDLSCRINAMHKRFKEPVIVEEYIDGREINVSILGNNKNLQVLPISEIDYSNMPPNYPRICSYKAKWEVSSIEYKNTVPVCPADLPPKLCEEIEDIAIRVYDIIGCRDYARIDIRLDKLLEPYIIDVNPNPCLNPDSGFVRSAKKAGFSYVELVGKIVDLCMERNDAGHLENTQVIARR